MSCRLFVGNIGWKVTDRELRDAFAAVVPVEDAVVLKDRFDGRSRGFGFVTVTDETDAQRAIEALNGQDLNGRPLRVDRATGPGPRESGNHVGRN